MNGRASIDVVAGVLRNALPHARLPGIPKQRKQRAIVLAVLSLALRRRRAYSETELNEILKRSLAALDAGVDHVTCRRYLVDFGFVRRDRAGLRYLLNFPAVESTLSSDAIASAERLVAEALETNRKRPRLAASKPD